MATFTNQATLRYNGNVINSNITVGELVEVLEKIVIEKTFLELKRNCLKEAQNYLPQKVVGEFIQRAEI